jgi:SAM-dependent methyltransferase
MEVDIDKEFLNIPLNREYMHIYIVRNSILREIRKVLPLLSGKLLDIGCGYKPYKSIFLSTKSKVTQYIGMDMNDNRSYDNKPEIGWDGKTIPLPSNSVDCAIATEVLEHSPQPDALLAEAYRILKPGGILLITVPFFWILHEVPYDEYRYTPFSLRRHVESGKFEVQEISAMGGWNASFAQMMANWIYFGIENMRFQKLMKLILFPIFKILLKKDKIPVNFATGQMITGLSCIAVKPL